MVQIVSYYFLPTDVTNDFIDRMLTLSEKLKIIITYENAMVMLGNLNLSRVSWSTLSIPEAGPKELKEYF